MSIIVLTKRKPVSCTFTFFSRLPRPLLKSNQHAKSFPKHLPLRNILKWPPWFPPLGVLSWAGGTCDSMGSNSHDYGTNTWLWMEIILGRPNLIRVPLKREGSSFRHFSSASTSFTLQELNYANKHGFRREPQALGSTKPWLILWLQLCLKQRFIFIFIFF